MRTVYDDRLEYLLEKVNNKIVPNKISISRRKYGKKIEYTVNIQKGVRFDWLLTGTYRETTVLLYGILETLNYFH